MTYNSGAAKVVWQGPPPVVYRGNASQASPEACGLFNGLESHQEEEEEEEEEERVKDYKGHKRATSFGTLDSGRWSIFFYILSSIPPPPQYFC